MTLCGATVLKGVCWVFAQINTGKLATLHKQRLTAIDSKANQVGGRLLPRTTMVCSRQLCLCGGPNKPSILNNLVRLCVLGEDSHNTPTDQEDVARHIRRFACTLWPHRPWRAMEGGRIPGRKPNENGTHAHLLQA